MSAWSPAELMTAVAARALRDDDVCFVGIGAPSAACNLARLTRCPNITLIYESGTIGTRPDVLPLSIGDGLLATTAVTTVSVPEMFAYWLQGGRITVGFLGAAQLDRSGSINTTVIGDYHDPKVRLPGAGGAPEIASSCQRVLVTLQHSPRTLVERVGFVTSVGRPALVVTDLCTLEPEGGELVVTALHPGVSRADVEGATGWPVRFAAPVAHTPPPTAEELDVLRDLHRRTDEAHGS